MRLPRSLAESVRHMREHKVSTLLFSIALGWALLILFAPLLLPPGTIDLGEEGVVGCAEHADVIDKIENPLLRFVYQTGEISCHQRSSRSFYLNSNQMPYCARCTAVFASLPLGLLLYFVFRRPLNPLWLIVALVPLGIDGGLQLLTDYESTNIVRAITGSLAGGAAGYVLGIIAHELSTIWKGRSPR
ncbi:MAG: DUF2085 domain-containing protein [Candidatus Thermoplasmatota archaeon]